MSRSHRARRAARYAVYLSGVAKPLMSRKRVMGGGGGNNFASALTGVLVMRAPAAFDRVRAVFHLASSQNTMPSGPMKMTFAVSAQPGYNPVTTGGGAASWTTATWGGASDVTLTKTAIASYGGVVETDFTTDVMTLASIARTDDAGLPPLIHVRIWAPSYVPLFQSSNPSFTPSIAEPDYINGTLGGDMTAAASGSAPINNNLHVPVTLVFYHNERVVGVAVAGDSTAQGSIVSANAVDGSADRFDGWGRQFVKQLNAGGVKASYENLAVHGRASRDFHETARTTILNSAGAGLDAVMLYPFSVNAPNDAAAFTAAKAAVLDIIDLAVANSIVPVLVRNPPGYETAAGQLNGYNEFFDTVAAVGKALIYDMRPAVGLPAAGYPAMPSAYRLHDSGGNVGPDGDAHPNNLFHQTVAADMFARRTLLVKA